MIGVVPTILKDREQQALLSREVDESLRLLGRHSKRLVDDHGQPSIEGSGGDGCVDAVKCRDDDEIVVVARGQHRVDIRHNARVWVIGLDLSGAVGIAGDDSGERHPGRRCDERRMEHPAGQPVTDERNPEWGTGVSH